MNIDSSQRESVATLPMAPLPAAECPLDTAEQLPVARQSPRRLTAIDALRGLAALIVVLPHSGGFFWNLPDHSWSRMIMENLGELGTHGVDVFFVLSGFVIATTSLGSGRALHFGTVPQFMMRRLVRIAPPYWGSLVLVLACLKLQSALGGGVGYFPTFGEITAHLLYLQELLGLKVLNVVYWTLCVEIQFYLTFAIGVAAIHILARRTGMNGLLAGLTGLVGSSALSLAFQIHDHAGQFAHRFFAGSWHEFGLGILAFLFIRHPHTSMQRVAVAAIGALGLWGAWQQQWHTLTAVATALLIAYLGSKALLEKCWNGAVVQYFGKISYSLYLVHVPVIFLWLAARMRFHPDWPLASWGFFAGMFVTAVTAAHLLHIYIEKPAMRWSRRWKVA